MVSTHPSTNIIGSLTSNQRAEQRCGDSNYCNMHFAGRVVQTDIEHILEKLGGTAQVTTFTVAVMPAGLQRSNGWSRSRQPFAVFPRSLLIYLLILRRQRAAACHLRKFLQNSQVQDQLYNS